MRYIICYDITENKIRSALAKYLEGIAYRIQESVFMCETESEKITEIQNVILNTIQESEDPSVIIVPTCKECLKSYWQVGSMHETPMPQCLVL